MRLEGENSQLLSCHLFVSTMKLVHLEIKSNIEHLDFTWFKTLVSYSLVNDSWLSHS